jgi:hypothetical protein
LTALAAAAAASGIAFDTFNEGNWLYAQSDDATAAGGSPHGKGIELKDVSAGGILLKTFATLVLEAATQLTLLSHTNRIVIESDASGLAFAAILLQAVNGQIALDGESVAAQSSGAAATLDLTAAGGVGLAGTDVDIVFSGNIRLITLPTFDPGISGALWNDLGTVKVSP